MRLSEHFTLAEYLRSYTATKYGISEQFTPPQNVVDNIIRLNNVVQKIRNDVGVIRITSGYRCPRVNTRVGGVSNSMHLTGEACDIGFRNIDHAMQIVDSAH
jgi:zinc D-Ala-D-Ala carboxypeptidase